MLATRDSDVMQPNDDVDETTDRDAIVDQRTLDAEHGRAVQRLFVPSKKLGQRQGTSRYVQYHIDSLEIVNKLKTLLQKKTIDTNEFFMEIVWEHHGTRLREGQEMIQQAIRGYEGHFASKGFAHSRCFVMPTGSGKGLAITRGMTAIMCGRRCAALDDLMEEPPFFPKHTMIAVFPTIALALENHTRCNSIWNKYAHACISMHVDGVPDVKKLLKLPEYAFGPNIEKPEDPIPIPVSQYKLMAGSNTQCSLFMPGRKEMQAEGSGAAKGRGRKQAAVIFSTYEMALNLFLKGRNPVFPGATSMIIDQIQFVVFDEAHFITESDRPAALALYLWCRAYNKCTIFLTATMTPRLQLRFDNEFEIETYEVHRTCARVALEYAPQDSELSLVYSSVEMLFGVWIMNVTSRRRTRFALFIENKLYLKITYSLLYDKLHREGPLYLARGETVEKMRNTSDQMMRLGDAVRKDASIQDDHTRYGSFVDPTSTVEWCDAFFWLCSQGFFLISADLHPTVRRFLTGIIMDPMSCVIGILTTSAIAEGVNIPHLRIVLITGLLWNKKIMLSSVRILQMLGRHDREDVGGLVLIPAYTCHKTTLAVPPPSVYFADILGGGVPEDILGVVLRGVTINFEAFNCKLITRKDFLASYPLCPRELVDLYMALVPITFGYMKIPYWVADQMITGPGFVKKGNEIKATLQMRVMRMFRTNDRFNLSVLAAPGSSVYMVSCLPCYIQVCLIALLLKLPQYVPTRSDFQKKRNAAYAEFVKARKLLIREEPLRYGCYKLVIAAIKSIRDSQKNRFKWNDEWNNWKTGPFACGITDMRGIALFLAEIALTCCAWELLVAEWTAQNALFSGILGITDAFIDILNDDPIFPVCEAQIHMFYEASRTFASDTPHASNFSKMLQKPAGMVYSVVIPCRTFMFTHPVPERPILDLFAGLPYDMDRQDPRHMLDNRLLALLCYSAKVIIMMYKVDDDRTLADCRASFRKPDTVSHHADLVVREDFVDEGEREVNRERLRPLTLDMFNRMLAICMTPTDFAHMAKLDEYSKESL